MAKAKSNKTEKAEKKPRKSGWRDTLEKKGYKLTGDDKADKLAFYRLTARNPPWSLKEVEQGHKDKAEKEE